MSDRKERKIWEGTNTTNLYRHGKSGRYYVRVKVGGKEKWRALKTDKLSVAKAKLGDAENAIRAQALVSRAAGDGGSGTEVSRFIAILRARTEADPTLKPSTKSRREIALKALVKTWPELPTRDARRVTPTDAQTWASRALRVGTGFVAPKAKTVRSGMSGSAFNKCVDALRAVFEIAKEHGAAFTNPADSIKRARLKAKRLGNTLPSQDQFRALVQSIAEAGARQSTKRLDVDAAGSLFERLLDINPDAAPSTRARNNLDTLVHLFRRATGTEGRTAWDAFNAITEFVDHRRTVRLTDGRSRAEARFETAVLGTGDDLKARAYDMLVSG